MNDDRVIAALADLAGAIDFPDAPDVRGRVRARLEVAGSPLEVRGWRRFMPQPGWARVAFGTALAVVLASTFLIASPGARRAVADFLGLPGVRIEFREPAPTDGPRATPGDGLEGMFGWRVNQAEAAAAAPFPLPVPAAAQGTPEYYVDDEEAAQIVALAFRPTEELPEIEETGYGLIVVALRDFPPEQYFGKLLAGPSTIVDEVEVNGVRGYWTKAEQHSLSFDGRLRASGNALLWQDADEVTYRVETAVGLRKTREIAESIP